MIQGKPGSGKSYEAVEIVQRAIKDGRPVVTNLPLKQGKWDEVGDLLRQLGERAFTQLGDWAAAWEIGTREVVRERKGGWLRKAGEDNTTVGAVVVVDEAGVVFDSLQRGADKEIRKLLAVHRHSLMDVYLLIQTPLSLIHI